LLLTFEGAKDKWAQYYWLEELHLKTLDNNHYYLDKPTFLSSSSYYSISRPFPYAHHLHGVSLSTQSFPCRRWSLCLSLRKSSSLLQIAPHYAIKTLTLVIKPSTNNQIGYIQRAHDNNLQNQLSTEWWSTQHRTCTALNRRRRIGRERNKLTWLHFLAHQAFK
jgi:hypothetical protein